MILSRALVGLHRDYERTEARLIFWRRVSTDRGPAMAAQAKPLSQLLQQLLLRFSEETALAWMESVFPTFSEDVRPLTLKDRLYAQAGMRQGKRLGSVRLAGEGGTVEVPVFLVMCARLGAGSQRKQQFLCAQRMLRHYGFASGADPVPGALFFFHAPDERCTRFSLVTQRKQKTTEAEKFLYRRQSFLLTADISRNRTFVKYFDMAKIRAFGTPGATVRGARDTLLAKFSVEALTKEFYDKLYAWYEWASKPSTGVRFPDAEGNEALLKQHLIRLITRLMFVWFVKERIHALETFFDADTLKTFLKGFNPRAKDSGLYYNAILQNLFFATLNCPQEERAFVSDKHFHGKAADYGVNTRFRGAECFAEPPEAVLKRFAPVPYLNGGLFECLDDEDEQNRKVYRDGFSRRTTQRALVPNALFFDEHKGLLPLLRAYDFTIDENHATDADIALDPELLGKVFENLLASYNPNTGTSARKASGSYYTPREVVDYMVDEAIRATLEQIVPKAAVAALLADEGVEEFPEEVKATLATRLKTLKTLDPACGSGAFPMGLLNRMVELLERLEGDAESAYHRRLHLISSCIYGVDIQPIAIQIAKLRFFISLLCDQVADPTKPNAGLDQLPNLEPHLVIANTLVGLDGAKDYLTTKEIETLRTVLKKLRDRHLHLHSRTQKLALRQCDHALRQQLQQALAEQHLRGTDLLAEWDPYDPCAVSPFFDPEWMFGFKEFQIVIGNPPYGAHLSTQEKAFFKARYTTAQTIQYKQKGSLDTYTLFIERAFRLLGKNGTCTFIVPISVTSSASLTGVHRLLYEKCEEIRVSSYAVRPQPVFLNATVNTSIFLFIKTDTPCQRIYTTKMNRKEEGSSLDSILSSLSFVQVKPFLLPGRIPKIGTKMECDILRKLNALPTVKEKMVKLNGVPLYYRVTGGRYFKVVTPFSTGSTKESTLLFSAEDVKTVGACLSTSLSFWFYQIYSNNLDWKSEEITAFPIPTLTAEQRAEAEQLYEDYLADIERNATVQFSSGSSSYLVDSFKAYHIGLSKPLIDKMDDFLGPLYGLTPEEVAFIKNYELSFRLHEKEGAPAVQGSAPDEGDEEL